MIIREQEEEDSLAAASQPGKVTLIINADDYGYTKGVSEGIRLAAAAGIVTSTSVMGNMPGVSDALALARANAPRLSFGCHLTMTAGTPVLGPDTVPSLVNHDGSFRLLGDVLSSPSSISEAELAREWRAQIEELWSLDVAIDHLDSHHHVSYLIPACADVMLALAHEYDLPVRRPPDPPDADAAIAAKVVAALGARMPDRFLGDLRTPPSVAHIKELVGSVAEGVVTELMVHPGIVDDELRSKSTYAEPRAEELRVLLDPGLSMWLSACNTELRSFGEVWGGL